MSDDWTVLAEESSADARMYLLTVKEIAAGNSPDATLPMALLALSQVLVMGARLGAVEDVVPVARFEPDPGPDVDFDPLRESLANVFEGLDEYADVADPCSTPSPPVGRLSDDLVDIASALAHGLSHHEAGRPVEALWWWQFSYLSHWGERAAAALRVVQALLAPRAPRRRPGCRLRGGVRRAPPLSPARPGLAGSRAGRAAGRPSGRAARGAAVLHLHVAVRPDDDPEDEGQALGPAVVLPDQHVPVARRCSRPW